MLHSKKYFNEAVIDSSKKALEELLGLTEEMLHGLSALEKITTNIETPIDRQTVADAHNLFVCAHRMLSIELAQVEHHEVLQKTEKEVQDFFEKKKVMKFNKATATA